MNKPTSVVRKEFIDSLRELITESHLPPYVIGPIIADIKRELDIATEQQYKIDLMEYEQSLEGGQNYS